MDSHLISLAVSELRTLSISNEFCLNARHLQRIGQDPFKSIVKSNMISSQIQAQLRMNCVGLKYKDGCRLSEEEQISQQVVLENTGSLPWPFDTYLIFAGDWNELEAPEETYVGMLDAGKRILIRLKINAFS